MGVGVQGEACGEVTEHAADRLDVHTVLQCNGGEGVAEVVESDLGDTIGSVGGGPGGGGGGGGRPW